jgi:phosphopantetheinyl transferase (holo-ACP synthase)
LLGNDIVDFSDPALQEKHKDTRFLDRVFTEEEKTAILKAENGSKLLWTLWSAKEAAFKACQKHNPHIIFSPKNFIHFPLQERGEVFYRPLLEGERVQEKMRLDLRWSWPSRYVVHCCAVLNENNSVFTRWNEVHTLIKRISGEKNSPPNYAQQSKAAREALIHFLQTKFQMSENLYISRPEILINGVVRKGPPILIEEETRLSHCEISLSHDNEWIAAVFYS